MAKTKFLAGTNQPAMFEGWEGGQCHCHSVNTGVRERKKVTGYSGVRLHGLSDDMVRNSHLIVSRSHWGAVT